MSSYLIAEEKIDRFLRAAMDYGAATVENVVSLNRVVGKARAELLAMFDDQYESPEEESDRLKEKLIDKINELMPSVVERIVADEEKSRKAAKDIREAIDPAYLLLNQLSQMSLRSRSKSMRELGESQFGLLSTVLARLIQISQELEGKKP